MVRMVAVFNLKAGVTPEEYESYARETDPPMIAKMQSIEDFGTYRVTGLLNGDDSPYAYAEVIDVIDMDVLREEMKSEELQNISKKFKGMTTDYSMMLTEKFY